MSRVIVKNLPKKIKEERLRKLFNDKGQVTDCTLKYTKDGVFRKFAFVGYKSSEEAVAAIKHFNKTFIDTSKIQVELAKDFGDVSKPRAWSKYSQDSSAHLKLQELKKEKQQRKASKTESKATKNSVSVKGKAATHTNISQEVLGELAGDAKFDEFLNVNKSRSTKPVWMNDGAVPEHGRTKIQSGSGGEMNPKQASADESSASDSGSDSDSDDNDSQEGDVNTAGKSTASKTSSQLSDMAYLKSKIVNSHLLSDDSGNSSESDSESQSDEESSEDSDDSSISKNTANKKVQEPKTSASTSMTSPKTTEESKSRLNETSEVEDIAESGRLFVRNLAFCCQEQDLEEKFGKYGPLVEVHLPLDSFTKKIKGFAFITYMMPEHALKAYGELDGTAFQGRMLHIIPGKAKKEFEVHMSDSMAFKKKKEMKQKQSATSSHNWNTLFIGANAVADLMADKYGTSKDHILRADGHESLGVRMALGETQIVAETKEFLVDHGIALEAFTQDVKSRSKSVILVKNLPASTKAEDLQKLFSRHGTLGRVVLPPSGVTGVVEFVSPTEAKTAFRALAYTKFQHLPLFLEWAPEGVFETPCTPPTDTSQATSSLPDKNETETVTGTGKDEKGVEEEDQAETEAEAGSSIFVKNLNFNTTEESLSKHFSKFGEIHKVTIAMKKDLKHPGQMMSMGYGFVEFCRKKSADKALRLLQNSTLDDHQLELKQSKRATVQQTTKKRKNTKTDKKHSATKILIRNIPFEAKQKEVRELFTVFGELKFVRLPKKMSGTGSHRGFGFVDFLSKEDAKRAFNALSHSTHLYGRRLVLEWADAEESVEELRHKTAEHFHDEPANKKFKKSKIMDDLEKT